MTYDSITVTPATPRIGAEVGGIDLTRRFVARIGGVGALSPTRVPGHAMRT